MVLKKTKDRDAVNTSTEYCHLDQLYKNENFEYAIEL